MANKFDVPPVQSTGILMQGLGQGLVEFGNVYGATKLATIEAEAQRNKEMRIMQMENIRNNMNDAFRYASYENDQARLDLARNADARAQLAEGRAERSLQIQESAEQRAIDSANKVDYTEVKVPIYQVAETLNIATGAMDVTSVKVGEDVFFVNKNNPSDVFKMQNGTAVKVSAEEFGRAQSGLIGTDRNIKRDPVKFETIEEAKAYIKSKNDSLSGPTLDKWVNKLVDDGFFEINNSSSQNNDKNNPTGKEASESTGSTTKEDVYEFEGLTAEKDSAPWYEKQLIPANPTLSEVGEFIAEAVKEDNPQDNEMFARSLGLPVDVVTSVINNVLMPKGSPIRSPIGGSAWLMKNRGLTVAQLVDMIKGAAASVVSEQTPPQEIVSPDDAMLTPVQESGVLMPEGEITTNGENSSRSAFFGSPNRARNPLPSSEDTSEVLLSRKDVLPAMQTPPQEIVSPEDSLLIPVQESGLLMPKGDSATVPDLGTGAYGEMPLDQPTNVSGPRLPTGDTGYVPPDNADMQYPQARKQAIDLVESMKNANLPEDVIRSELLRLIQEIPQEQANSAYAQALVDVFNELFSGNN